ncbi:MAG: hypothetical protein IKB86_03200 [Clostridia bacterium]|nr:hypothetical protein [Clostridia bacterium]
MYISYNTKKSYQYWCDFFAFKGDFKNLFEIKICWTYIDTLVSGSPIVQDGKRIGAVTHVMLSDATRGYGIFIENMLDAAA